MDIDWGALVARKYDLLQQNATADTTRANASANLDAVRARLMPAESQANVGLTNAQRLLTNANAQYVGPLARSSIALNAAQAGNLGADSRFTGARTTSVDQLNRMGINGYGFSAPQPGPGQDSLDGSDTFTRAAQARAQALRLGIAGTISP